jgi:hypothetical protein
MELIMTAACQRRLPAELGGAAQQRAPPPQFESEDGREWRLEGGAQQQQQWGKPAVVLVGATLEEPLVEHAVERVGGSGGVPVVFRVACPAGGSWGLMQRAVPCILGEGPPM